MSHESTLRESLFNAEPVSRERQQRFRQELAEIMEPPLSRGHRLYYAVALVGLIAGLPGAVGGLVFDAAHRWLWALLLTNCTVFACWIAYILRRGAEPLRIMQGMSKAFAGGGALLASVLIACGFQSPSSASVLWAILGLLVFLLTSFINLWNRVLTAENAVREQVLRVEYRLADFDRSK